MAISVVMPALEMAQETGRLLAWRKREGESVTKGEPLMEVETDKAAVEIEAPADGLLSDVSARAGDVVRVGATIAWILAPGEDAPGSARALDDPHDARAAPSTPNVPTPAIPRPPPGLSPKARRLAAERGAEAGGAPNVLVPQAAWRTMAGRMVESWTSVPHFFMTRDVDAAALQDARERLSAQTPDLTLTDFLVAIVARTLVQHPRLNASWIDERLWLHDCVNIGLAAAVEHGVVVPVIHDAAAATLSEIARRRRSLIERARARSLRLDEVKGGTFTISNLGMFGVQAFTAIVTPPQVAILAVGRVLDKVVAVDGQPAVRPTVTLTLSADHRAADGALAATFMDALSNALQHPELVQP